MKVIRTRFAPSPTGYLHVGGIRTAVFAWLVARQAAGQFVLRLEDTDKKREVGDSADHLMQSLKVLGLNYDEGPDIGGPFAPYRQSQRLDSYKQWAQKLINMSRAYADPFAAGEVQAFREEAAKAKKPFLYRNHRPENPPPWDGTQPLRFKSEPKSYVWHDAILGELSTGPEVVDDFILIKSDGFPTYNFAHIIDDYIMEITHIIRGQEFISSLPNYLNLYEALGLEPPIMATVPHILAPDGHKKLSKRDGAKDVLDYMRDGFLPDALVNFIVSLGWNDGTEQEIFSREELIEKFSLQRVQHNGAHFDERRLLWMNGSYIRQLKLDELYAKVKAFWPDEASNFDREYKIRVLGVVQERLKYFAELPDLTRFFFADLPNDLNLINGHKQLKKVPLTQLVDLLEKAKTALETSDFSVGDLTNRLNNLQVETRQKPVILYSLIRIAATGASSSPGLADTLSILGKERSFARIDRQLAAMVSS